MLKLWATSRSAIKRPNSLFSYNPQVINGLHRQMSTKKPEGPEAEKKSTATPQVDPEKMSLAQMTEVWDRSIKKNLAVVKQARKKNYDKQALRAAILFEDLLQKEKEILIYDAGNVFLARHLLANLIIAVASFYLVYYWITSESAKDNKFKEVYIVGLLLSGVSRFWTWRRFQKYFVERIVYNTASQNFTFTMRNYIPTKYTKEISRNELLFTADEVLNRKKINYINMSSLEQYSIGYKYAWKNEALFAHLISQRIKTKI